MRISCKKVLVASGIVLACAWPLVSGAEESGVRARIASVLDGSPAMVAGLYAEDEIVALDGLKCDASTLLTRCDDKKPGDAVKIAVFRREKLLEVPVTLGAKPADGVYLARLDAPTEAQKASYRAWLGASWDESEAKS